jgi:hypothetical protein
MKKAFTMMAIATLMVAGLGMAGCKSTPKSDCSFCNKTGMMCKSCAPGAVCAECEKCAQCPDCTADKACDKCMTYMKDNLAK